MKLRLAPKRLVAPFSRVRNVVVRILTTARLELQPYYTRSGFYLQIGVILACAFIFQWWGLVPSIAIGFLGFVAVVMTVRDEDLKKSSCEKIIWICITFVLLILEVRTTYREHDKSEIQQAAVLKEERESFSKMLEQEKSNFAEARWASSIMQRVYDQDKQRIADLKRFTASANQAKAQAAKVENLPGLSFKKWASDLSSEIFSFLADRQAYEPRLQGPMTREAAEKHFNDTLNYLNETTTLYNQKFTKDIMSLRDALSKQGMKDSELDEWYEQPTDTRGIERIAVRLGVLAEKLKE